MAKAIIMGGGGGGTASDEVTAKREDVLNGKTAVTSDSNDEAGGGTMPDNGAVAPAALAAGGSYTIPKGYHNGQGKVTAKDLASQTAGTAGAGDIRKGKTAVVGGKTVTGSMAEKGAQTYTPGTSNQTIAANQFLTGAQTIAGDADLTAGNIRTGANIFGKVGTYKGRGNAVQANVESGKTFSTASLDNASGSMAVMSGGSYTPSKSQQTISCSGKKMSSNITINAIPSNFADLTAGAVVFRNGAVGGYFSSYSKDSQFSTYNPDGSTYGPDFVSGNTTWSSKIEYDPNRWYLPETGMKLHPNNTLKFLALTKTIDLTPVKRIKLSCYAANNYTANVILVTADKTKRYNAGLTWLYTDTGKSGFLDVSQFKGHFFLQVNTGTKEVAGITEVILLC